MKRVLLLLVLVLSLNVSAQRVINLDKQVKKDSISYTKTKDVAVYHGKEYPVYVSKNNKYFIFVVSRNGNTYKKYLKLS